VAASLDGDSAGSTAVSADAYKNEHLRFVIGADSGGSPNGVLTIRYDNVTLDPL
jgi:hypothetical protein